MTCRRPLQRPANPCECVCQVTFNLAISLECTMPHYICWTVCRIESSLLLWDSHDTLDLWKTPINFYLLVSYACMALTSVHFSEVLEGRPFLMISPPTQHSTPHTVELKNQSEPLRILHPPMFAHGTLHM